MRAFARTRERLGGLGRPFRRVLASDALSLLAIMVGQVSVPWWIAREGGARDLVLYVTLLYGVSFVALPLLSPLGDRVSKRVLIAAALATMALQYAALAGLAHRGLYRIEWIIALTVIEVLALAVTMPMMAGIVAELLPPERLAEGLGLQKSAQALGRLAGPLLGGAMVASAGVAWALWLNVALLLLACSQALGVTLQPLPAMRHTLAQWLRDLRAGFAAKWGVPTERGWTLVSFLVMLFFMPGFGMLVPLKLQSLGLSGGWLGGCEAGLSIGLLIASLGGATGLAERLGRFRASLSCVLCQGLLLVWIGLARHPLLLVLAFTLAGFCVGTSQLVGQTHRSLAIPQHYRARMAAVNMMAMQLASVLGPALAGLGLSAWPIERVYLAFGAGLFVMALGYALVPGYRRFLGLPHAEVAGLYAREHPGLFGAPPHAAQKS